MAITKFTTSFNSSQPLSPGLATVSASTGSPTIDSSTRAGKTIYKYTGSGSITISKAGYVEYMILGGGGAGASAAGGAGGYVYNTSGFLPAGTLTITVGAGGANTTTTASLPGNPSAIASIVALGGGRGGNNQTTSTIVVTGANGGDGGSGGGGYANGYPGGAGLLGQGNSGGTGPSGNSAAGGGAGGAASGNTPGVGIANAITGTSVTYCTGGNPTGSASPVANSGDGGRWGAPGASGYVVIVIG